LGLAGSEEVEVWAVEEEDFLGWHFDGFVLAIGIVTFGIGLD
jgi:hypothetical protein